MFTDKKSVFILGAFTGFVITITTVGFFIKQTMIPSELVKTGRFYNDGEVYEIIKFGSCKKRFSK